MKSQAGDKMIAPITQLPLPLLEACVENAEDGILITDARPGAPDGPKILFVNPCMERISGYSADELVGSTPRMLQGRRTSRSTLKRISAALSRSEPIREKVLNYAKNGTGYWLELSIFPVRAGDDSTVTHFVSIQRDVTQQVEERKALEKARAQLENQALHDELTGLSNRAMLYEEMAKAAHRAERGLERFALLYLDLDDFKETNDEFGHEAGDKLLIEVAKRMRNCVRDGDTLARIGGDEFVALLQMTPDADPSIPEKVAARMAGELQRPVTIGDTEVACGVSIGVAECSPEETFEECLRRADAAMYKAKDSSSQLFMVAPPA